MNWLREFVSRQRAGRAVTRSVHVFLTALVLIFGVGSATVDASPFTYDAALVSLAHVYSLGTTEPAHPQLRDALEASDPDPVADRSTSTTLGSRNNATEAVRPPSSPNYSVEYEAQLPEGAFPGRSAEYHFSEANRQLHGAFESDPAFAASMEAQYPGIVDGVSPGPRGGFPRESPTDALTWHHEPTTPGTMQLVPYEQHVAPGPIQGSLHPGGKGGMAIWGGGR